MSETGLSLGPRPDHICCIARNEGVRPTAWCESGEIPFFVSIDHAARNAQRDGRLVACPECVAHIVQTLCRPGLEAPEPEVADPEGEAAALRASVTEALADVGRRVQVLAADEATHRVSKHMASATRLAAKRSGYSHAAELVQIALDRVPTTSST
jgi:hypothetical protein